MLRLIGRLVAVAGLSAGVALALWAYAMSRPGTQLKLFQAASLSRISASGPAPADNDDFRVTACAAGPCVLVEAGGFAFLVNAGDGSAETLAARGLLRPDLDAVLLTDLSAASISGLGALRTASWRAGRKAPLQVFGPPGVERVVQGTNEALFAADAIDARFHADLGLAAEPANLVPGPAPVKAASDQVLEAGAVTIRRFIVGVGDVEWLYRFDFGGRVLAVGACGARSADLAAAVRGAEMAWAVLPAASVNMLEIQRQAAIAVGRDREARFIDAPARVCLTSDKALTAFRDAHLAGAMLAPLYPTANDPASVRAWRGLSPGQASSNVVIGEPGARLELASRNARSP